MRKTSLALLIGSAVFISACGSDATKEEEKEAGEPSSEMTSKYSTEAQQHSYAIGASLGMFAKNRLQQQQEAKIEVDQAALEAGFNDALAESLQFEADEIQGFAQASDTKLREAQTALASASAEENIAKGQAFLEENAKKEGVETTESGLQYEVVTAAEGASPASTDTVTVHYKGTLIDGTEFDSSYSRGEPASFPLNRVIPGWTEGLQLMTVGSTYRFYIPSELGYGTRAAGSIPPNSTLIFDVELLDIAAPE